MLAHLAERVLGEQQQLRHAEFGHDFGAQHARGAAEQLAADDLVLLLGVLHILCFKVGDDPHLQDEQVGVLPLVIAVDVGAAGHKGVNGGLLDGFGDVHQRLLEEREEDVLRQINPLLVGIVEKQLQLNPPNNDNLCNALELVQGHAADAVISVGDQITEDGNNRVFYALELSLFAAVLDVLNETIPSTENAPSFKPLH